MSTAPIRRTTASTGHRKGTEGTRTERTRTERTRTTVASAFQQPVVPLHTQPMDVNLRLARASVLLLLAATGLQVVVHAVYALGWLRYPDMSGDSDVDCVDPPCGPESLPPLESFPAVAPLVLLGLALLLGFAVLAGAVARSIKGPRRGIVTGLLLMSAPLLVLIGGEVVPHAVTPCWFGEIPGVCERTDAYGVDWDCDIHMLAHGLIGWVPSTVLAWWLLARWRPEVLPNTGIRPLSGRKTQ